MAAFHSFVLSFCVGSRGEEASSPQLTFPPGQWVILLRQPLLPSPTLCLLCQVKLNAKEGVLFQIRISARWEGGGIAAQSWERNHNVMEYFSKCGPSIATARFLDTTQNAQVKLARRGARESVSLLSSDCQTPASLTEWEVQCPGELGQGHTLLGLKLESIPPSVPQFPHL